MQHNKYFIICSVCCLLCFLSACHRNNNTHVFVLNEKNVPCVITCQENNADTANVLPANMVNQIIHFLKTFKGTRFTLRTDIPDTWLAEYKLAAFADFDIWIITNAGDPVYKILATITTDTSEIIQAIPVAYNAAREMPQYIESEYWQCHIDDIYSITVSKEYEKLQSLSNDSATNSQNRHKLTQDKYTIEANGNISYVELPHYDTDYEAVILFADTANMQVNTDDTWLWNTISMQEHLEPVNIIFQDVYNTFDRLSVINYNGEEVDVVNISEQVNRYHIGYVLLVKNEPPLYIPYDTPHNCLRKVMLQLNKEIPADWGWDDNNPENELQ